ncbi:MAG TPA: heat-inducible transcriptional repressor HrcA [Candidatus Dormibacteraeota bacterium]|nr:heat-inducible transcriptional repressor HrcA [Candidatus Dormibacteraeota bacterium]
MEFTSPPLDPRKQQILKAVVSDYTETGLPVGSQALAAKYLLSWSAATIRNELASLVDVGYLLQPHTSAGRVPSDRGYRYYVDFLMEEEEVGSTVRRRVDPELAEHSSSVDDLLETAAILLAVLTNSVSIVTGPQVLAAKLKHLDVLSLDPRHALLVVLLEGNLLRQQVIELGAEADQETLSDLSTRLNAELRGLGPEATDAVVAPPAGAQPGGDPALPLRAEVVGKVRDVMRTAGTAQSTVILHDGVRNLLRQPEFGDVERLQQVLDVLEEERLLAHVLASLDVGHGLQVVIGAENEMEQLRGCSLVITTYRAGQERRGTLAVLGPTRMRYPQIAPRLRYIARCVGEAIERMLG